MFGFGNEYEGLAFWLPVIWAGVLAVAVIMYVIADGFDLGVGILFDAADEKNWRDRMMFSVAPIWDGNETWLILGGAGLFCVFSLAYAILMPALYMPMLIMVIALVFRGIAFEFRFKAEASQRIWDNSFHYGSFVATFAQGIVLGAFVQGFHVTENGRAFAGGAWDWLTPFSLMTGVGLVCGYGLLGATWLVMKTTGDLEAWARRKAVGYLLKTMGCMAVISLWVPFLGRGIQDRWFAFPNFLFLAPIPILTVYMAFRLLIALEDDKQNEPFFLTIGLFLLGFLGLGVSLFPYLVPPNLTIWHLANTPEAQLFVALGYIVALPVTFAYTAYAYWVFRGKVAEEIVGGGYG